MLDLFLLSLQVSSKHLKGGKECKIDVLVMENLLFRHNVTRLYDLKGSSRSRYNADTSGKNNVLLDQNLIESMPTSPIFLGSKAKRLLERAVWNDTSFLAVSLIYLHCVLTLDFPSLCVLNWVFLIQFKSWVWIYMKLHFHFKHL